MRFSLKWILFGMAYVALAAAALTQNHWAYADLLWLAAFVAICMAIQSALFNSGSRRAIATGFALFALGFAACAQFAEHSIPTRRLLLAAGVPEYPNYQPMWNPYTVNPPQTTATFVAPAPVNAYPMPTPAVSSPSPPPSFSVVAISPSPLELPLTSKVRAANAVGSMTLGLLGGLLAAAAFRRRAADVASAA
ncbi:MAG: hypothetical protein JNL18_17390 [Planctomycetaceae bacterium]|nr:hypothetical protein [Planctomycetaceae bacterium]